MDKFAVAEIKNKKIIGHIPLKKTGRFFKTIFTSWNKNRRWQSC